MPPYLKLRRVLDDGDWDRRIGTASLSADGRYGKFVDGAHWSPVFSTTLGNRRRGTVLSTLPAWQSPTLKSTEVDP